MNPTHATQTGPVTVDQDAAFLGCLMRCDASQARRLLAGMRPDDLAQPIAREVLALAIRLHLRDIAPGPAVLLAEARRAGRLDTEHKHHLVADWLIDTYRAAPDTAVGDYLKTAVLEAALRRGLREHATRLLDRVDHVEADHLDDLTTPDDRLTDLWQRHQHATTTDPARPDTPTKPSQPDTGQLSARSAPVSPVRSTEAPAGDGAATGPAQPHSATTGHGADGEAA